MKFELNNPLRGIGAIGLFAVIVAVVLAADFPNGGTPVGFADGSITASLGYALIGLQDLAVHETESFLIALIIVAVLLDAALEGAVMLARRDVGGQVAGALRTGGEEE